MSQDNIKPTTQNNINNTKNDLKNNTKNNATSPKPTPQQVQTDQTASVAKFMDTATYQQMLTDMPTTYELLKKGHDINPDAPALSYFLQATDDNYQTHETLSYAEFLAQVHQVGNFIDSLNLEDDAVIAMLLPNLPEGFIAIFGIQTRHIVMPINPLLEPEIISELLSNAKARALITFAPFPKVDIWQKAQYAAEHVPSLAHVITINMATHVQGKKALPAKLLQFKQNIQENGWQALLFAAAAGLPAHITHHNWTEALKPQRKEQLNFVNDANKRRQSTDLSSFFCTGGTTGRPKIAMRQHKNEVSNVLQARAVLGDEVVGSGKTVLCGLPLFHVNALMVTGALPLSIGGHILLATPQGYRGEGMMTNFWKIIAYYRVNFFSGVPTLFSALLDIPIANQNVSSLEYCLCGAAPMPVEVFKQFEAQTGISILEAYGMTEGNCGSSANPKDGERKIGSVGLPFAFQPMSVVIVDDTHSDKTESSSQFVRHANVDEVGVIAIRGDNVFVGYHNPSQNSDIWIEDNEGKRWLNTGDLGYQDSDGYFFLTGRKKELIIRGGHNIDPKLIEEPVYQHESVALCAAIGKPDVYAGELPILYVQPKPNIKINNTELIKQLQDYCQTHIAERAAIPKAIHIIDEMPLTPVGKVFKPALKRLANVQSVKELLTEQNITATISTPEHPKYGFITKVEVNDTKQLKEAQRLVGQLSIASEVTAL
ncbi:acyl-CoA synthetase [Psychrobacter sp. I-STPA10]|uniref:acyl-CoA synthetase n=1 Tax=Psychrobacter sp. I-STPA10 TaxID=2585769 RepID=UPI001E4542B1|nr:acyl-CoA synthetase [Psychrobacter sp. I-STPA10]